MTLNLAPKTRQTINHLLSRLISWLNKSKTIMSHILTIIALKRYILLLYNVIEKYRDLQSQQRCSSQDEWSRQINSNLKWKTCKAWVNCRIAK